METFENQSVWRSISLDEKSEESYQIGNIRLQLKMHSGELWLAHESEAKPGIKSRVKDIIWNRWALVKDQNSVWFYPVMPDKAVVVRPEYPFRLVKGAVARVYVRIPVWIGISLDEDRNNRIFEIPTVALSKTWFGEFTSGELCYMISTSARRVITENIFQQNLAVCTLDIKNQSNEDLQVEKLCIRVERLSIFISNDHLWTDEMEIIYKGNEAHSEIIMTGKIPEEAGAGHLITHPRLQLKRGFKERAFGLLKEIPGF